MLRNLLLPLFGFLAIANAQAQSDLVVFSDNGERFFLVVNGQQYNKTPETNVKAADLKADFVRVKIIFENGQLPEITNNTPLEFGSETTMMIKQDKKGAYKLIWRGTAPRNAQAVAPIQQPMPAAAPMQQPVQQTAVVVPGGTVVQQTTTTTTIGGSPNSANVSIGVPGVGGISINVNDGGMGMNETIQQTTTTTTIGTNTNVYQQPVQQVQPVQQYGPGWNGRCYAMAPDAFAAAKRSIEAADFEQTKLSVAQQIASSHCMTSGQVREVLGLFDFEQTKLDFAKRTYPNVWDPQNYFMVNDAFDFDHSKQELAKFTSGR